MNHPPLQYSDENDETHLQFPYIAPGCMPISANSRVANGMKDKGRPSVCIVFKLILRQRAGSWHRTAALERIHVLY